MPATASGEKNYTILLKDIKEDLYKWKDVKICGKEDNIIKT